MQVFVSYARQDRAVVDSLVADLERLGHQAWYDDDLSGGQAWWNEIVRQIKACDVLLFVLSSRSAQSEACKLEARYGADLARSILPLRIDQSVSVRLLPAFLAERQLVDYTSRDVDSIIALTRAMSTVAAGVPLPDPLPEPPAVPFSYLTGLAARVALAQPMAPDEQWAAMAELRARLADTELRADVVGLLRALRARADVLAIVAQDIDHVLASSPGSEPTTTAAAVDEPHSPPTTPAPRIPAPRIPAPRIPAPRIPAPGIPSPGIPAPGIAVSETVLAAPEPPSPPPERPVDTEVRGPRLPRWALPAALAVAVVLLVFVVTVALPDDDGEGGGETAAVDDSEAGGETAAVDDSGDDQGEVFEGLLVFATSAWTDTGIELVGGERVQIDASGEIGDNTEIPDDRFEPGGEAREDPDTHPGDPYLEFPHAALIGHIIGEGEVFEVGYGTVIEDAPAGKLHLGINDGNVDDNSDKFVVDISVEGP